MRNPMTTVTTTLLLAVAAMAGAEDSDLGRISVTAPGLEQRVEDVQATVEIVDEEKIQSYSGRSLTQVLQLASGLNIKNGGSRTQIFLRGFDEGQALILVDGIRRTGKFGNTDLGTIQLADVERVEIVRGSMSALYGSDAMAGVINIVTKKPGEGLGFDGSILGGTAEAGQRETVIFKGSGNLGRLGNTLHRVGIEARWRDDFRENSNQPLTDLDEEERLYLSYDGAVELTENQDVRLSAEYFRQDDEGVGASGDNYEKEDRYQFDGKYHLETDKLIAELAAGYGLTDAEVDRGSGKEETDYSQMEANAFLNWFLLDGHITTLGFGARRQEIDLTVANHPHHRNDYDVLVQDQWEILDTVSLVAGVRYDYYTDFGATTNPRATLAWHPGNWTVRGGFGTAFKAPDFTNLYGTFRRANSRVAFEIRGNPDLDPETSWTLEGAVGYRASRFAVEAAYHYSELEDLIDWVPVGFIPGAPPTSIIQYENVNEATIQGAELTFNGLPFEFWNLWGSFEYLDATDAEDGSRLADRPRWQFKLSNAFTYQRSTLYAHYRGIWDYFGLESGTRDSFISRDHHVVDLKLAQGLWEGHVLSVGVDNVLDKETPVNMGVFGAAEDPGARFYYASYSISL